MVRHDHITRMEDVSILYASSGFGSDDLNLHLSFELHKNTRNEKVVQIATICYNVKPQSKIITVHWFAEKYSLMLVVLDNLCLMVKNKCNLAFVVHVLSN